jgi:hypothetical protein
MYHHHVIISAVIVGKLSDLCCHAESGIAINSTLPPTTQAKRGQGRKMRKIYIPFFTFCY